MKNGKIIGYNYKSEKHRQAFNCLVDFELDYVIQFNGCDFGIRSVISEKMEELEVLDQFADPIYETTYPNAGQEYRHENGNIYKVLYITNTANHNEKYLPQVVYQGRNGNVWSRPLVDWDGKFKLAL